MGLLALVLLPAVAAAVAYLIRPAPARLGLLVGAAVLHLAGVVRLWAGPVVPELGGWLAVDALGLVVLEDERHAIPPYDAVVLASPRLARDAPDVLVAVRGLEGAIDVVSMRALNLRVDEEHGSPADVAAAFLRGR